MSSGLDSTTYIALMNVAFNDNIREIEKVSYDKTIDVQFGYYAEGFYKDWLTVNLKPSHGGIDWLINLKGWATKTPYGKAHAGYWGEFEKYKDDLLDKIIRYYMVSPKLGILLAGRSKGAAEAELLIPMLPSRAVYCLAIDPPKCCDEEYGENIRNRTMEGMTTCYKNDIVPGIPFWFRHPFYVWQNGKRRLGLSIKDHETATTEKEVWL